MAKPTLLILSLGELGTHLLEAAVRSQLFDTIIVASRDKAKAQARANNALIGAGIEGFFPNIVAEELDFNTPGFAEKLAQMAPDFLFSAPSMLPWWKVDGSKPNLPFAGYTALHLALMVQLREQVAKINFKGTWIGASYPDVINAVLNRTGFGPDCGIGNVQEPISKVQVYVAQAKGCKPQDVQVQLVAQHAFEYYVLNAPTAQALPPHLIKATLFGQDVSDLATQALLEPFPFPYDLHFNRVTASAGIMALKALTSDSTQHIHLPGIGDLVGGYPVQVSRSGISLDLPSEWTLEQAVGVNEQSLIWDGIDQVTPDGTIVYSEQTQIALRDLLGRGPEFLTTDTATAQAQALLSAL